MASRNTRCDSGAFLLYVLGVGVWRPGVLEVDYIGRSKGGIEIAVVGGKVREVVVGIGMAGLKGVPLGTVLCCAVL
jgi:hypothetical protein